MLDFKNKKYIISSLIILCYLLFYSLFWLIRGLNQKTETLGIIAISWVLFEISYLFFKVLFKFHTNNNPNSKFIKFAIYFFAIFSVILSVGFVINYIIFSIADTYIAPFPLSGISLASIKILCNKT